MDKNEKAIIKKCFTPPPAQRKAVFAASQPYPKEKPVNVFLAQIGFIRKRVWISAIAIVISAFLYTDFIQASEEMVVGVSAMLPLLSLCMISELFKSIAHNMAEMELACKYNLSYITLMRIGILGTVSFAVLALCIVFTGKGEYGLVRSAIYLCVPCLLSSYLSLLVIIKLQARETMYICAAISGAVSMGMVMLNNRYQDIYLPDALSLWGIAFLTLAGLFVYTLAKFTTSQEELRWNS